jgi:hypothetical protein
VESKKLDSRAAENREQLPKTEGRTNFSVLLHRMVTKINNHALYILKMLKE